jgi:hypothetical protein
MLVIYGYISFPISQLLKGDFPQKSSKGQICMKIDFQVDQMNQQQRMTSFILPLAVAIFRYRFMKKINDYVKGQNLNLRTFSQFGGKHQRNMCTAAETSSYLLLLILLIDVDNGLIIAFQFFGHRLNTNTQFFIQNFIWIVTLDLFFGLYVPVKHIIESRWKLPGLWLDCETDQTKQFYVRTLPMSPRRYVKPTSEECEAARTRQVRIQFAVGKFAISLESTKPNLRGKRAHTLMGNFLHKYENTKITPID